MAVNLHKKAATTGIILKKRGIETPPRIRVGLMMDISGSMRRNYTQDVYLEEDGHGSVVQHAINHTLGMAMAFDPTHRLDVFVFDDDHAQLPVPATPANFHDYVRQQILNEDQVPKWSGTQYAPVMHQFQDHYFGEHPDHQDHRSDRHAERKRGIFGKLFGHHDNAPPPLATTDPTWAQLPVLGLLFTDGENSDHREARAAFERSLPFPVFWSLVGIGDANFHFIRQAGERYEDAEFVDLEDLHISDEMLYSELVSPKLVRWLQNHQAYAPAS